MMSNSLREGYLLIQNAAKKWKIRWCVLWENELVFYHKKNRALMTSNLLLQGCAVVCPCPDVSELNATGPLKLHLPDGEDVYLHAGGAEDRDQWAHAIGAVIRSLSTSQEVIHNKMTFQDFHTYANVSEIIGAIQDPDAGVESANHLRGGLVFKNCFGGKTVVDWLMRWSLVRTRSNGSAMGQTLLKLGHIQEVDLKDGTSGYSPRFSDSDKLYRFTSINLGATRNSFYDSSDSESSSSDDENDDVDKEYQKMKKGKPVKEGFLEKKHNIRKGWKIVKASVRETPPAISYYRAVFASVSEDKFPKKVVSLVSCKVMEIIKPPSSKKTVNDCQARPRFSVVLRTKKGKNFSFRMKDEQEKEEWMNTLMKICAVHQVSELGAGPKEDSVAGKGASGATA